MTRQMADDEVLRVLDRCVRCAAVGANPHYAGWHDDMTRSHAYVAALQAERDADWHALIEEAASKLPHGVMVVLEVENGCADVHYKLRDGSGVYIEPKDDTLAEQFRRGIDAALAAVEGGG